MYTHLLLIGFGYSNSKLPHRGRLMTLLPVVLPVHNPGSHSPMDRFPYRSPLFPASLPPNVRHACNQYAGGVVAWILRHAPAGVKDRSLPRAMDLYPPVPAYPPIMAFASVVSPME